MTEHKHKQNEQKLLLLCKKGFSCELDRENIDFPVNEGMLARYINNQLDESEREKVEARLAWDDEALETLIVVKAALQCTDLEKPDKQSLDVLKNIVSEQNRSKSPDWLRTIFSFINKQSLSFGLGLSSAFALVLIIGFQLGMTTRLNTEKVDVLLFDEIIIVNAPEEHSRSHV